MTKLFFKQPLFTLSFSIRKVLAEFTASSSLLLIYFLLLFWVIFVLSIDLFRTRYYISDKDKLNRTPMGAYFNRSNKLTGTPMGTYFNRLNNNFLFSALIDYHELGTFPKYIKTASNKYILVKAVKDDLVYFHTFDDLFKSFEAKENNSIIKARLCTNDDNIVNLYPTFFEFNPEKIYEYNFFVGLNPPKANIAPTSILIDSENSENEFYQRIYQYKKELCQ